MTLPVAAALGGPFHPLHPGGRGKGSGRLRHLRRVFMAAAGTDVAHRTCALRPCRAATGRTPRRHHMLHQPLHWHVCQQHGAPQQRKAPFRPQRARRPLALCKRRRVGQLQQRRQRHAAEQRNNDQQRLVQAHRQAGRHIGRNRLTPRCGSSGRRTDRIGRWLHGPGFCHARKGTQTRCCQRARGIHLHERRCVRMCGQLIPGWRCTGSGCCARTAARHPTAPL